MLLSGIDKEKEQVWPWEWAVMQEFYFRYLKFELLLSYPK